MMRPVTTGLAGRLGRARRNARGFTLLELLVAISILAMITGIVYAALSGVTNATELARIDAERLRLERFLRVKLRMILEAAYTEPACIIEDYALIGTDGTCADGPADTLELCSSAALGGAMLSLPGSLKRVTIGIEGSNVSNQSLSDLDLPVGGVDDDVSILLIQWNELQVSGRSDSLFDDTDASTGSTSAPNRDAGGSGDEYEEEAGAMSGEWQIPVLTFDIAYFDGEEWVDEWDSINTHLMPWAVRFRINLARSPEDIDAERQAGWDLEEDPDLDIVVPIAMGAGALAPFFDGTIPGNTMDSGEGDDT